MTKSDLRTGMVVTLRNGEKYNVYRDIPSTIYEKDILTDGEVWMSLKSYAENLLHSNIKDFDIVKVEKLICIVDLCRCPENQDSTDLLWERKEPKKMTVAEIETILGYEVEIVSDK